jgi:hypothetical protein
LIKILKYRFEDGIGKRSLLFLVVISVVVLILAFVSAQDLNATPERARLYVTRCAVWHGADHTGKNPTSQSLNLRELRLAGVWEPVGSDLSNSVTQISGETPALGITLGEDQRQLLVAHIHESTRSRRLEKWPWQPVTKG